MLGQGLTRSELAIPGPTTLSVRNFVPRAYEPGWKRTKAIFSEGSHTLTYKMGGSTYGPVTFVWALATHAIAALYACPKKTKAA